MNTDGTSPSGGTAEHRPGKRPPLALHWKILIGLVLGAVLGMGAHAWFSIPPLPGQSDARDQDANGVDDRLDQFALGIADPLGASSSA